MLKNKNMRTLFMIPLICILSGCSYTSTAPSKKVEAIESAAQENFSDTDIILGKVNQVIQDYIVTGNAASYTDRDTIKHDIASFFRDLKGFDEYSVSYLIDSVFPSVADGKSTPSVSSGDVLP